MLEAYFKLKEEGSSVRTEVIAGVTTFLTMSYIIFVNPDILSSTGMDRDAVFVATCVAAAIGSAVMGMVANWPIGMAPGMGLNAFFAFTVVAAMGFSWQQALGAVFISGVIFLLRQHLQLDLPKDDPRVQRIQDWVLRQFDEGRQTSIEWEELAPVAAKILAR